MDDDLPRRLSEDLEGTFPDVVATHQHAVFTTALRMSGRPEDAADIAAEAFLRAYTALRGYPPARIGQLQVRPWLLTIVLNLLRNEARAASRRPAQVALEAWPPAGHRNAWPPAGDRNAWPLAGDRNAWPPAGDRNAWPPAGDRGEGPEEQAQRHDGQARLGTLLTGLPEAQRTAVVLRHVVGLPYAEMAAAMGCPEGTAKSHVARGLQRLRAMIPEEER